MTMKQFLTIIASLLAAVFATAQEKVTVSIIDGIYEDNVKIAIETNLSNLLTEVNSAVSEHRSLSFKGFPISRNAQESMSMLWSNVPFLCEDKEILERLITTSDGYQVRNIPISLCPEGASVSDDLYQEAVVDFDKSGEIQSFYFGLSNLLWKQVMKGEDVGDLRRRQQILDYVEHFRTAYNQKDISFLDQVFSDDALIITGKVIKTKPSDFNPMPQDKIVYNMRTKKEYLSKLKNIFSVTKYVKVSFSEIRITRHPTKPDFYGVLLRQGYSSDIYSDDGYLFLLWDFRDESLPQIHVRTWQPYYLDNEKTKVISDDEIFDISSFDF